MRVSELFVEMTNLYRHAKLDSAAFECNLLLKHFLNADRFLDAHKEVLDDEYTCIIHAVKKRCEGYPLQYLLGEWEFYGFEFYVGEGVLIPRQDTETLIDCALDLMKDLKNPVIVDLCSGTGCIAITLAKLIPSATIYAVEISPCSCSFLEKNIQRNGVTNVSLIRGDVLDIESLDLPGNIDLIVSNPPYIKQEAMEQLSMEVKWEPGIALKANDNGLEFYKYISKEYKRYLNNTGSIAFEIGYDQQEDVEQILKTEQYFNIKTTLDLCNNPRVVTATANL